MTTEVCQKQECTWSVITELNYWTDFWSPEITSDTILDCSKMKLKLQLIRCDGYVSGLYKGLRYYSQTYWTNWFLWLHTVRWNTFVDWQRLSHADTWLYYKVNCTCQCHDPAKFTLSIAIKKAYHVLLYVCHSVMKDSCLSYSQYPNLHGSTRCSSLLYKPASEST